METKTVKILLIDDDRTMLDLYATAIQLGGQVPLVAQSGKIGIELAGTAKPDIILLDMMMPEMSGLETLEALKKSDATKDIPVMIFTNLMSTGERDLALAGGALAYIVKSEHTPQEIVRFVVGLVQGNT